MEVNALHSPISSTVPQVANPGGLSYRSQPWYLAYMDALFESDRKHVGERIKQAEKLIVQREREMLGEKRGSPEQRALANSLHALRALRSCFGV
jgi:hypothetical protein